MTILSGHPLSLRSLLSALAALVPCAAAAAQHCDSYLFPFHVASAQMAKVSVDRAPILNEDKCPVLSAGCVSKTYALRNDAAIVSGVKRGAYACVAFVNGTRQTTGWVLSTSLAPMPASAPNVDWIGRWSRVQGDSVITVRKAGAGFRADAIATYAVSADNVRTGTAQGLLTIHDAIASFGEGGDDRTAVCRVNARRVGDFLLVEDGATDDSNSACGGMGVTLNGIYRRSR